MGYSAAHTMPRGKNRENPIGWKKGDQETVPQREGPKSQAVEGGKKESKEISRHMKCFRSERLRATKNEEKALQLEAGKLQSKND